MIVIAYFPAQYPKVERVYLKDLLPGGKKMAGKK
jgi:hypothetical protein